MRMNAEEKKEREMRRELIPYSMFKSFMIRKLENQLKNTHDEGNRENLINQIKKHTQEIDNLNHFKAMLDNILEISDILKVKKLTKEEIKYYTTRREDFRTQLKEVTRKDFIQRIEIKATLPKKKLKRKNSSGLLGNPNFMRTWGFFMILFVIFGSLILILYVFSLKY